MINTNITLMHGVSIPGTILYLAAECCILHTGIANSTIDCMRIIKSAHIQSSKTITMNQFASRNYTMCFIVP